MRCPACTLAVAGALVLLSGASSAQPRVSNADLRVRPAGGAVDRGFIERLAGGEAVVWVGYAVPAANADRWSCCSSNRETGCCVGCRLEPFAPAGAAFNLPPGPVRLEGRDTLVLYRVEKGRVNQIRTVSDDCPLDAGGRIVHWLSGVRPTDSVALLATFLEAAEPRRLTDAALAALAMHAEPAALERLAAASRSGATGAIRGQALFWLAQRAGDKTGGVITDAIARDPDTEVKRRAVFALSQLPADQGVPLLIQVARTQANPVVRRQAIFWLGQSKDARALAFIEEILFGK